MYYFIDCDLNNNNEKQLTCAIMDYNPSFPKKTNTNYIFIDWNKKTKVSCSCITNFLQITCPHIKWFGLVYLNSYNYRCWTTSNLEKFKNRNTCYANTIGKNQECLICLENIHYCIENTINCHNCNYSIHKKCWHEYHVRSKNPMYNCILCKSKIN